MAPSVPRPRRRGSLASAVIRNAGIGLTGSLMAGAVSQAKATAVVDSHQAPTGGRCARASGLGAPFVPARDPGRVEANPLRHTSLRSRRIGRARLPPDDRYWCHRHHLAVVAADQLPSALMYQPVVAVAKKRQVVDVRCSPVRPVLDVMRRSPRRRTVTAWPLASSTTSVERASSRPRWQPARASDVHDCGVRSQQHPRHARIAREPLHRGRADRPGTVEHAGRSARCPDERLDARGDLKMRTLTAHPRERRCVETVSGEFDERVRITSGAGSIVITSSAGGQRIQCGTEGCATHRVQESLDEDRASFTSAHLERSIVNVPELLGLESLSVVCVSSMSAVDSEPTQGVIHGLIEKRLFLERDRRWGSLESTRGAGHEREMREPEAPGLNGRDALRQAVRLRADGDGARRSRCAHPALQAHPVKRAQATLPLLLLSRRKRSRDGGELQLNPIDDPAQADELVAQRHWVCRPRSAAHRVGGRRETPDHVPLVTSFAVAITHYCSIHIDVYLPRTNIRSQL